MKKILLMIVGIVLVTSFFVSAQTALTSDQFTGAQTNCLDLKYNMSYHSRDARTNGEVSDLQNFLKVKGFLYASPDGSFGPVTLAAVKKFQSSTGIGRQGTPGYGGIGPKSRAKIKAMTCGEVANTLTPTTVTSSNLPAGCSSTSGFSVTTGGSCSGVVTSTSISPSTITLSKLPEPVTPITTQTSVRLNSCTEITKPGNYLLDSDVTNTGNDSCIKIQNVSNLTLDCQNHTITSKNENHNIYVKASTNFKLNNCKLTSSVSLPSASTQHVLRIEDSKQGEVNNNTVGGNYVSISGSSFVTVRNSTFTNQLNVYKSNNVTLRDSNFSNGSDPITLQEGGNNSVISNIIDGKSDGIFKGMESSVGADDGIVIKDENGDLIQGNTLKNFFDCAIENVGKMFDAKIIGNNASNAGVCFLGGWYYSSVKGILVKDNVVSNMPNLFYFYREYTLKSGEQYVYFQNNTFENNKLSNPKLGTGFSIASRFTFDGASVSLQNHVLGNNILRNNDFTKSVGPLSVSPASIIVDGGGNICSGAEENVKGGGDKVLLTCN